MIFPRATILVGAALALVAGCSGGQAGSVSQTSGATPVAGRSRLHSWVNLALTPTVFVSSSTDSSVYGFNQKTGTMTEQIANLPGPNQIAADGKGYLYVSTPFDYEVLVYPPGSTTPSRTLTQAGPNATGIAVSITRQVAVLTQTSSGFAVVFYGGSGSKPIATRALPSGAFASGYITYDGSGNLWMDLGTSNATCTLLEMVGGGRGTQVQTFLLTPQLPESGGLAIDNADHILVAGDVAGSSGGPAIEQYQLPSPQNPTATVPLTGSYSGPRGIALTGSEKAIYTLQYENNPDVWRLAYPAGGKPRQTINVNGVAGIAVTPWAKP